MPAAVRGLDAARYTLPALSVTEATVAPVWSCHAIATTFRSPASCGDTNDALTVWTAPEIVCEFACWNFTRPVETSLTVHVKLEWLERFSVTSVTVTTTANTPLLEAVPAIVPVFASIARPGGSAVAPYCMPLPFGSVAATCRTTGVPTTVVRFPTAARTGAPLRTLMSTVRVAETKSTASVGVNVTNRGWAAPADRIVPADGAYANVPSTLAVAFNCRTLSGIPWKMSDGAAHVTVGVARSIAAVVVAVVDARV